MRQHGPEKTSFASGLSQRLSGSRGIRSVVTALLAIVGISALFMASAQLIGLDENGALNRALTSVADSNLALPVTALCFALCSLIGAPQFLLIAVTVTVFGPWTGFAYAVCATLVNASMNFYLSRLVGAEWLRKQGWSGVDTVMDLVGRNGFWAALLVRVIPSAPFIVVNMGLGLTRTPYAAFISGTAIGILPKIALIALLGKVVDRAYAGEADAIFYLSAAAAIWLALAVMAKRLLQRRTQNASSTASA
ncbi:MAG: VTT domain-containing protein [Pseudomonadota bacterium]